MSGIIRVTKDTNYFRASNEPFNNELLSWEARGVMGYLLSKPDGWQVQDDDLIKRGPASGAKIKRILDELKEHGYLTRNRVRKPDGTFEWVTEVYESRNLNPEANSLKLKQWAQEKQDKIKAKRKRAYERRKKKTIGVLYPNGETIGVLTTNGSSTNGEYPNIVKTESVKTESVKTEGSSPAAQKLTDFYFTYISNGKNSKTALGIVQSILNTYNPDDIIYAIEEAVKHTTAENNKCTLAYVETICKRRQAGEPDTKNGRHGGLSPAKGGYKSTSGKFGQFAPDEDFYKGLKSQEVEV